MRADSMSRQEAIDVLKRNYPSSCFEDLCKAVDIAIKALSEQPEPHWIPCSDRYPDMDERVLVYTVAHEYHVWDCMSNRADNYFWEDEAGLYHDKYVVDLWMPLPEPYKENT